MQRRFRVKTSSLFYKTRKQLLNARLRRHWALQSSGALGSGLSVTLQTQREYPGIGPSLLDFLEEETACGVREDAWWCLAVRGTTLTGNLT